MVYKFTHTLAQYLPSVYAEICVVSLKNEIDNFLKIEKLPIVQRVVWVSCITDGYGAGCLYHKINQEKLFGGPWRLAVNDYAVNPMLPTILGSEHNPFPQESYLVTMKCIYPGWYSMQQEAKIGVFSRSKYQTISDCVNYILTQHNAKAKHIDKTTVSFNWLQSNMTDYEFIRSVLAYCNPSGYHFYCNNEEGFFKPIGTGSGEAGVRGNASAGSIVIDIRGKQIDNLVSIVNNKNIKTIFRESF